MLAQEYPVHRFEQTVAGEWFQYKGLGFDDAPKGINILIPTGGGSLREIKIVRQPQRLRNARRPGTAYFITGNNLNRRRRLPIRYRLSTEIQIHESIQSRIRVLRPGEQ